jgi:hypothetical protein
MRQKLLRPPLSHPAEPASPLADRLTRRRRILMQPRLSIHSRASVLGPGAPASESPHSHPADEVGIVKPVSRFFLTLLLVVLALASAGVVAFGTHPRVAQYPSGLEWITLARRLQWPLTALCLLLSISLIALVTSGKRSAAWLICLAPILYLFYYRFMGEDFRRMAILDNPTFITEDKANYLKSDSQVIGLVLEGQPYAYPCGALALAPVIVHADADKRVLIMYSPYAGRAQAFVIDPTIKPRELDIVSMPADALLLYNSRIGQFINGFTGTTLKGDRPEGFKTPIELRKTTWREWRSLNPDTKVLGTAVSVAGEKAQSRFPPRPVVMDLPASSRVMVIAAARPVVVDSKNFPPSALFNVTAGGTNLLVFRDPATHKLRAFDRAVKGDLFPKFSRRSVAKKPDAFFYDTDTDSLWNIEGHCIAGNVKGEQLRPLMIEEDVSYATLKSFYPNLEMLKP